MGRETFRWRPRQVWELVRVAAKDWVHDRALSHAAALSYYALFALGPLLLVVVGLAGLLLGGGAAQGAVLDQVGSLMGEDAAAAIETLMADGYPAGSVWSVAIGSVALLFGAAGVFRHLRDSLNAMWEIEVRKGVGWKQKVQRFVRKNVIGFAGVFGVGFLLLVSLVVSAFIQGASGFIEQRLPLSQTTWRVIQVAASLFVFWGAFAGLFRYMPDARITWRDVAIGSAATSILFVVGQALIALYLTQFATTGRYGAAGSVIVLLVWVYYSTTIVYFGAELTQVYANRYGQAVELGRYGKPIERRQRPSQVGAA